MLTVFFLVKFTKKPLRFFGLVGIATFGVGALIVLYLVGERLFFGSALADRPALLLSSLLVVLGVQIFALGLIGELILFTHAKDIKEYTIEKIINREFCPRECGAMGRQSQYVRFSCRRSICRSTFRRTFPCYGYGRRHARCLIIAVERC